MADEDLELLQLRAEAAKEKMRLQAQTQTPEGGRSLSDLSLGDVGGIVGSAVVQGGENTLRRIDDVARSVADVATFGYADEIAAYMNELTGLGGTYEENVAQERERDASIPLSVRILGGAPGAILPTSVVGAVGNAARLGSVIPRFLRAPTTGAAYGAAYGSGASEEGERLPGAAVGGTAGLALASLLPMAGGAYNFGRDVIRRRTNPSLMADQRIGQAILEANNPGKVGVKLQSLGPRATLADVGGREVQGLARAAGSVPGAGSVRATTFLQNRQRGEGSRVNQAIQDNLAEGNFYDEMERGLATLKNNAAQNYQEAFRAGRQLDSPELNKILNRPVIQDAMKEAADLARIQGRRVSPLAPDLTARAREAVQLGLMDPADVPKGGIGRGITTEAIDDLKKGLDVLIDRERNPLTQGLNKRGAALNDLKNELLREVDRLNPLYAQARRVYAGDAETLQAFEQGRKAMNRAPEAITRELAEMSEASQSAYRLGAARALQDTVSRTRDTASASNRIFGNKLARDRLRAVFPDNESYRRVSRELVGESVFNQTRNFVLGGSQTAPRLAEQQSISGPVVEALQSPASSQTAIGIASELWRRATAPNPRLAGEIAQRLFATGPQAHQAYRDALLAAVRNADKKAIGSGVNQATGLGLGYGSGGFGGSTYGQNR